MSNPRIGEQLQNPLDTFRPLHIEYLQYLRERGRSAVGIVAAILNESGDVLMLGHKESHKTHAGAIGPLAETSQLRSTADKAIVAETCTQTLARGFWEEMQVTAGVPVLVSATAPAFEFNWPAGKHTDTFAHAICPVVRCEDSAKLLTEFAPTAEVQSASFKSIDEIMHTKHVRAGTIPWLETLLASDAYAAQDLSSLLIHPGPVIEPTGIDIKFDTLSL